MNMSLSLGIPLLHRKSPSQESALIEATQRGDRQAFDSLVWSHESELRTFLRRRVSEAECEDLIQDTWVAAWNSIRSFDRKSRFKTWLFSIALNKTRDYYRSGKEASKQLQEADIVIDDQLSEKTVLKEMIRQSLAGLTQNQREVLELYYFVGLTLPEIARTLNRNLNTVKYQFYRAHVEVTDYLRQAGQFEHASQGAKSWQ